jgi:phage repressor protein C with HTH and peptisase S24 domain
MATNDEIRRENLLLLIEESGTIGNLADKLERSSSQISQWKNASKHSATGKARGMNDESARYIEERCGKPRGWLDERHHNIGRPVIALHDEEDIPGLVRVKKVRLRLSAGIAGYAADVIEEDESPISFRSAWLAKRGYSPERLVAIEIRGQSMEPGLYDGDTVVINTADTLLIDGEVYAVNYEGEAVVKRLVREMGSWWLVSDNPDQRRFPRKQCAGDMCIVLGRVVHKQSERI